MKPHEISASAKEITTTKRGTGSPYENSSTFEFAFKDELFLTDPETRGVRLQLEIMKPDTIFRREGIKHTLAVFGSARFIAPEEAEAKSKAAVTEAEKASAALLKRGAEHYAKAYRFAQLVATRNMQLPKEQRIHILTGGGPGIMEAANRGAFEVGDKTIGMNIALPFEQAPNPYITPSLCFDFHYFAARKFSFLSAGSSTYGPTLTPGVGMSNDSCVGGGGAVAIVCFPGGFGTLDEAFECLTLVQTKKIQPRPIIFVGKEYWSKFINVAFLAEEGVISPEDVKMFHVVDSPEEAWEEIKRYYVLK
jgi:predicted Rossmann-fold nucleotide-binding protein